jgi:hypothetical protein
MILQLIYLFGEILFVFLALFFLGGLLGGPAFKTDTGQIILFFKKVTGSIR